MHFLCLWILPCKLADGMHIQSGHALVLFPDMSHHWTILLSYNEHVNLMMHHLVASSYNKTKLLSNF